MRKTYLKSNPAKVRAWQQRSRKPLRKASKNQADKLATYYKLRAEFLATHPMCELPRCPSQSRDVHHMQGRGPNLNRVETWMACCRKHHDWIHQNPALARGMGLLR